MEKVKSGRDAPNWSRAVRLDSIPLGAAHFTPEGFLRDKPILTSIGIFEYATSDGSVRRELRLPEEVFSPESLKSYKAKPVCLTHDAGLLDKSNTVENSIGTILSEGIRDGNDVRAEIVIYDPDKVKRSQMRELSVGYELDVDPTPGVWHGERYDAVQRNIVVNHLAIVENARAGEQARLNMDSKDKNMLKGGKRMSKKSQKTSRVDAVVSDEELQRLIEEYKRRRGAENADADDEELIDEEPVEEKSETEEPIEEQPEAANEIEDRIAAVKAHRDRRDEQGDPEDMNGAMGIIAEQDLDIDELYNIIDTLLAKLDYNEAAEAEDSVDEVEKLKGDEDDVVEEEPEEDTPVEDEPIEDEDEDLALDEDDVEDEEEDEEYLEDGDDCKNPHARMDAASVDRLVSTKIMLGELGHSVGLDGLAHKSVDAAKRAIIKKVRPEMRLDGKSTDYINAAFEYARAEIKAGKKKNTMSQKRQMFNMDRADVSGDGKAEDARERMKARQMQKNNRE